MRKKPIQLLNVPFAGFALHSAFMMMGALMSVRPRDGYKSKMTSGGRPTLSHKTMKTRPDHRSSRRKAKARAKQRRLRA